MEDVESYLVDECHYQGQNLKNQIDKLRKYPDILEEFTVFLKTKQYPNNVQSEGYTAVQIQQLAPFMEPLGVYNFLISLRDNPEFCKQIISDGFPRQ